MSEQPQLQTKLQIANYNLQLTTTEIPLQVLDYRSVKGNKQCLGRNKKRKCYDVPSTPSNIFLAEICSENVSDFFI